MEVTETKTKTTPSVVHTVNISSYISRQLKELQKDPEETFEALDDAIHQAREAIMCWFSMRVIRKRQTISTTRKNFKMCCCRCSQKRSIRQDPKESPQNDPGLPEALEALRNLKLSSGYQSRDDTL
ncbi:RGD1565487 (predicted) [Rattus norvegicus]|uniref:RGD1565487 (Predicted) n=1 Tax=Rattus norvegicus TaxID=10116 RepID=A6J883_RAT|nr:RGD1565487 (predicted) [Rattus norvegicus]|eukprot:XP_006228402.1 PREDICTED: uncharacterized protein Crxos1 [Rattus norvegicus]